MLLDAINHPEYWRSRAEEARAVAAQTRDTHTKALMLKFAQDYEKLAKRAPLFFADASEVPPINNAAAITIMVDFVMLEPSLRECSRTGSGDQGTRIANGNFYTPNMRRDY
jgi:hypothetical protein